MPPETEAEKLANRIVASWLPEATLAYYKFDNVTSGYIENERYEKPNWYLAYYVSSDVLENTRDESDTLYEAALALAEEVGRH